MCIALIVSPLKDLLIFCQILINNVLDSLTLLSPLINDSIFWIDNGKLFDLGEFSLYYGAHHGLESIRIDIEPLHSLDEFIEEPAEMNLAQ